MQNISNRAENVSLQGPKDTKLVRSEGEGKFYLNHKIFLEVSSAINKAATIEELIEGAPSHMPITMASYHHFAGVGAFDYKSLSQYFSYKIPPSILKYYDEHYKMNSQHKSYPVTVAAFSKGHSLWLSEMVNDPFIIETGHDRLLRECLKLTGDGLCIPLYGSKNRDGYMFIAFGKDKDACDPVLPFQVQALAQMLHIRYCLMREELNKQVTLTNREAEVLELITFGKTNQDIALILDISPNTVAGYVARIFLKLDVSDRVSAAMRSQTIRLDM